MKRLLLSFVLAVWLCAAQTPYSTSLEPSVVAHEIAINKGSAALYQSLKKLHTRASLIMITAHPDDEDGGMLTYESRGKGARVSLLTLNRGEGGANVISPDYFDALGLVRTQELLSADRFYGVDQYWTRVVDYGFSKTMDESIQHWTRDRVLYDVVRVVRMVRPLVVTSVFVGGPSDGHGNHQTAGAMAQAVFKAAGDPNVFPDQIRAGLRPWSPVKGYARVPFFRRSDQSAKANVQIPEGTYDPVLGASYVQIAREGLGMQKSQNGGPSIPKPGELAAPYRRFGSTISASEQETDFFDGIDVSLGGIASLAKGADSAFLLNGLKEINVSVEQAISHFSAAEPERCAPALAEGARKTGELIAAVKISGLTDDSKADILHELNIKQTQFNNALAQSLSLSLSATVALDKEPNPIMVQFMGDPDTFTMAIPGQKFGVNVRLVNASAVPIQVNTIKLEAMNGETWAVSASTFTHGKIAGNKPENVRFDVRVPLDAAFTRPYFTRPDLEQSYYDIKDDRYLNRPLAPYPLAARADVMYQGVAIRLGQYVQTVKRENGLGAVLQPLVTGPAMSVTISPSRGIVPLNSKSFEVKTLVKSNVKGPAHAIVRLQLPQGWRSAPVSAPIDTAQDGDDRTVIFRVTPAELSTKPYKITAMATYNGTTYREGYSTVGYSGLRPYFLYKDATYQTSGVDVTIAPSLNVGYVMGSGDEVPDSLRSLGIAVRMLSPAEISSGDLSGLDAIVLGVRTYAARPELATYNNRILDYVKNGGVVIVQYNTPEYDRNFGPFPYSMTSNPEEVTDEASKVNILAPDNPIFKWPNKISEADFGGWVEERGSKWMKSWDPHYEALLETHDPNQEPQKGGLLYARYGKGVYIYNAYAFYRQLPEGVPGAYRIFANMISLAKNPQLK